MIISPYASVALLVHLKEPNAHQSVPAPPQKFEQQTNHPKRMFQRT